MTEINLDLFSLRNHIANQSRLIPVSVGYISQKPLTPSHIGDIGLILLFQVLGYPVDLAHEGDLVFALLLGGGV